MWSGQPENGSCSSIGDDIYTQVMGPERHGRVRGYGLGSTPSTVFGSTSSQSRAAYVEVHTQLNDVRQQMEGLKTKHSEELLMQREEMQREMQRHSGAVVTVDVHAATDLIRSGSDEDQQHDDQLLQAINEYLKPKCHSPDSNVVHSEGWTISAAPVKLHEPCLLAMAVAECRFLEAEYDKYATTNASGAAFSHSVTLILMALLLLRHALMLNRFSSFGLMVFYCRTILWHLAASKAKGEYKAYQEQVLSNCSNFTQEYWGLVENGVPAAAEGVVLTEAQKKHIEDQQLKDLKAKNYLFQALDRSILEKILNKNSSKDNWDSMK
ncbi:hypothetical protein HHK36_008058 [Tetracentron sinense]|uniref:Uncharacterized protein n=1 Tax=Tetracentron sinense TaxID=13715 RepID=A0A835DIY4_TETSI|nr:hypothetical protein HHK36_008058 [Tetracentron sinense]